MTDRRRLLFGLLGGESGSKTSWLRPESRRGDATDIHRLIHQARLAESAFFDIYFLADGLGFDPELARSQPAGGLEPLTALSAVALATTDIGIVPTASTSFNAPYNLARRLSSLDHISGGRAGWNIVTSSGGEANFGWDELPPQEDRYARAREFVEVAGRLWDSWQDDAVVFDKSAQRYAQPERIHSLNHRGEHFAVAGPLNIQPSPQRRPLYVQAGSSTAGKAFGAEVAELIYTAQQHEDDAIAFRSEIRAAAVAAGRSADDVAILPGISPVIGDTEEEAERAERRLLSGIDYEAARTALQSHIGGADLSGLDLDQPIPASRLPETDTLLRRQSRPEIFRRFALTEGHTLRDVIHYAARAHGHGIVRGTPLQIAERIRRWYQIGAADGFILMPPEPEALEAFVTKVVPILQDWGLAQNGYAPGTLRERVVAARRGAEVTV
ncbi:MAG: FMN-dependent oxidoreductase, nitrilotriacetate monooxygenase family [Pseudarthrobacter sp.]|nr:FMN-dependent oxidoreductase, nitrilotriacetate monooxygenase family [Pseudarthrobacter sp.]